MAKQKRGFIKNIRAAFIFALIICLSAPNAWFGVFAYAIQASEKKDTFRSELSDGTRENSIKITEDVFARAYQIDTAQTDAQSVIKRISEIEPAVFAAGSTLAEEFDIEVMWDIDVDEFVDTIKALFDHPFFPFDSIEKITHPVTYNENDEVIPEDTRVYTFYVTYPEDTMVLAAYRDRKLEARLNRNEKRLLTKCREIIASVIRKDMSDYEKTLAIYNYIIVNARYDMAYIEADSETRRSNDASSRAHGVLLRGRGVCSSYASAFALLLNMVGIDAYMVYGEAGDELHGWNKVLIDGSWYNFDITWGDPLPNRRNGVCYKWFGLTDDALKKTHTWDESLYPEAVSTKHNFLKYNGLSENECCRTLT